MTLPKGPLIRSVVSILLDLVGLTVLVVAGWWLQPWVGMAILGIGILVVAWAIDPPPPADDIEFPEVESEAYPADAPEPSIPSSLDWGTQP